jgi:hypothetical protein
MVMASSRRDSGGEVFGGQAEVFENLRRRRRFAEGVNPQRINASILAPPARHPCFDTDPGQTMAQDFLAVSTVLTIENRAGGDRNHPDGAALSLK